MWNLRCVGLSIIFYMMGGCVMANNFDLTMAVNGSANSDSVIEFYAKDGSYTLITRGDTRDENMPGIGIFEGDLNPSDFALLKSAKDRVGRNGGFTPYSAVGDILAKLYESGSILAKLEARTSVEGRRSNGFVMDLALKNSGRESITFQSPAAWEGAYNPMLKNSWVLFSAVRDGGGGSTNSGDKFSSEFLGRQALVNGGDFPSDYITVQPGQVIHAKFLVWPSNYFKKGRYKVGATVSLKQVIAPEKLKGSAEFISGADMYVDFPRDYPSTLDEIRAFATYLKTHPQE